MYDKPPISVVLTDVSPAMSKSATKSWGKKSITKHWYISLHSRYRAS